MCQKYYTSIIEKELTLDMLPTLQDSRQSNSQLAEQAVAGSSLAPVMKCPYLNARKVLGQ